MKRIWIYDTEQLHNFHCSVFIDRHSDDTVTFEISEFKNELKQLQQFVREEVAGLWGWNNHEYDDVIYRIIYMTIKPIALKWIEENAPLAWFKPMFQ